MNETPYNTITARGVWLVLAASALNRNGRCVEQAARRSRTWAIIDAGLPIMLTAITNLLLRRTLRRWFEEEPDVREIRRKLDRFITRLDAPPSGWTATD